MVRVMVSVMTSVVGLTLMASSAWAAGLYLYENGIPDQGLAGASRTALAQEASTVYPVDSMIRLTGILEVDKQPQISVYPLLAVWLGEKTGQFQVTRAEPIIPEYPAESELRQVSELGLRLLAEKEALAALQDPQMQGRSIVIEGWLHVQQGSLDVRSVRAAATSQSTPAKTD